MTAFNPAVSAFDGVVQACRWQAETARKLGSPFAAEFLHRLTADVTTGAPATGLFEPWEGTSREQCIADAVALRAMAAIHDLALHGSEWSLREQFPNDGRPVDWPRLWPTVRAVMETHADRLRDFMAHEPQTNEVGRSACLLGGYLAIAAETVLPLRCLEIGASAGLNLNWDRYRYDCGAFGWGPKTSPCEIRTDWSGAYPDLDACIDIAERRGCDRRPVDLAQENERRRLLAYVWADQHHRRDRLAAALRLAQDFPVRVDRSDAGDWLAEHAHPVIGQATIVAHTVVWQYLSASQQKMVEGTIRAAGAHASDQAPVAWLRMEAPDPERRMQVCLTSWPRGETRVLAEVHPHGATVQWRAC